MVIDTLDLAITMESEAKVELASFFQEMLRSHFKYVVIFSGVKGCQILTNPSQSRSILSGRSTDSASNHTRKTSDRSAAYSTTDTSVAELDEAQSPELSGHSTSPFEFNQDIKSPFRRLHDEIRAQQTVSEPSTIEESSFNIANSSPRQTPDWALECEHLLPSEEDELEQILHEEHLRSQSMPQKIQVQSTPSAVLFHGDHDWMDDPFNVLENGRCLKSKFRIRYPDQQDIHNHCQTEHVQKEVDHDDLRTQAAINDAWFGFGDDAAGPYVTSDSNPAEYRGLYDDKGFLCGYEQVQLKHGPSQLRKISSAYKEQSLALSTFSDGTSNVDGEPSIQLSKESRPPSHLDVLSEPDHHHPTIDDRTSCGSDNDSYHQDAIDVEPTCSGDDATLLGGPHRNEESPLVEPFAEGTSELADLSKDESVADAHDQRSSPPPRPSHPSPHKARHHYRSIEREHDGHNSDADDVSSLEEEPAKEYIFSPRLRRKRSFPDFRSSSPRTPFAIETPTGASPVRPVRNNLALRQKDVDGRAQNVDFLCTNLRKVSAKNEDLAEMLEGQKGSNQILQNQLDSLQTRYNELSSDFDELQCINQQLTEETDMLRRVHPNTGVLTGFLDQNKGSIGPSVLDTIGEEEGDEDEPTESNSNPASPDKTNSQPDENVSNVTSQSSENKSADHSIETTETRSKSCSRPSLAWSLNKPLPPRPESNDSGSLFDRSAEQRIAHDELVQTDDAMDTPSSDMEHVRCRTKTKKTLVKGWQKCKNGAKWVLCRIHKTTRASAQV